MSLQHLIAIHQPNFFPWLGYFAKIFQADTFIILDDVQYPRTNTGTWSNRVKMLLGEPKWLTMPVKRSNSLLTTYKEIQISSATSWREKICKTLQTFYGKSLFFKEYFPLCEPLIYNPTSSLLTYNVQAIKGILNILQWKNDSLRMASEFTVTSQGTQRLIDLVKVAGGNAYLAGGGTGGYQEDHLFAEQGVYLRYQNFCHPVYAQTGQQFVPGLSILDALFNIGSEQTKNLLNGTCLGLQLLSDKNIGM